MPEYRLREDALYRYFRATAPNGRDYEVRIPLTLIAANPPALVLRIVAEEARPFEMTHA